jgi:hypothetical protein
MYEKNTDFSFDSWTTLIHLCAEQLIIGMTGKITSTICSLQYSSRTRIGHLYIVCNRGECDCMEGGPKVRLRVQGPQVFLSSSKQHKSTWCFWGSMQTLESRSLVFKTMSMNPDPHTYQCCGSVIISFGSRCADTYPGCTYPDPAGQLTEDSARSVFLGLWKDDYVVK